MYQRRLVASRSWSVTTNATTTATTGWWLHDARSVRHDRRRDLFERRLVAAGDRATWRNAASVAVSAAAHADRGRLHDGGSIHRARRRNMRQRRMAAAKLHAA